MATTLERLEVDSAMDTWRAASAINNALFWDCSARQMSRTTERWSEVWAADPAVPNIFPNSATLTRSLAADASALIERLQSFYDRQPGGPWMIWSAWETPDLTPFGMRLMGHPPLMARWPWEAPARSEPDGLDIREIDDAAGVRDWVQVLINGYPTPEMNEPGAPVLFDKRVLSDRQRLWVGYTDGEPVSCSAAYVDGTVNGVYAVATLPSARGRGFGAALTDRAANADPSLPAILTASDLGQPVYRSLGFKRLFDFTLWMGQRSAVPGR